MNRLFLLAGLCSAIPGWALPTKAYLLGSSPVGGTTAVSLYVYNWHTLQPVTSIPLSNETTHIAVNPNGKFVYTLEYYGSPPHLSVISVATNEVVATIPIVQSQSGASAYALAVTPDGKQIWVGSTDGSITVICAVANAVLMHFQVKGLDMTFMQISPDGKFVYLEGQLDRDYAVEVYDTEAQKVVNSIDLGAYWPQAMALSPDGEHLYIGSEGPGNGLYNPVGEIEVVDMATNLIKNQLPLSALPFALAVSPDGKQLYVGEDLVFPAYQMEVFDLATNKESSHFTPHLLANWSHWEVSFTPDGRSYWLGQYDGVQIVNPATQQVTGQLVLGAPNIADVFQVVFLPTNPVP